MNMVRNVLINVVVSKVVEVVVLPSATPPKMVKIKNIESPHVKPLLTSLQKVSLLVLVIVDSAIKKISAQREVYRTYCLFVICKSSVIYSYSQSLE